MISTVSFRVSVLDISAAPPRAHALTRTHLACSAFARGSAILKLQRRGGNSTNINKSVSPAQNTPSTHAADPGWWKGSFFFLFCILWDPLQKRQSSGCHLSRIPNKMSYLLSTQIDYKREPNHIKKLLYWLWEKYISSETCKNKNKHEIRPA